MNAAEGADDGWVRECATDPRHSVLLQAPAGSGKTTVLTQRLLRLLAEVDEPEEILAITFTRKAAAEMRARVLGALRGDVGAPGSRQREWARAALERSQRRGWNLLDNPARLSIQTIDAFNFRIAAQLPLGARAGGSLTVTDKPREMYLRAARQTLQLAEGERELGRDVELLFLRLDNQWSYVETLLADMLEKRAHWLRHVLSADPGALCERIAASLRHLATGHLEAACRLLPSALREQAARLPGVEAGLGLEPAHLAGWKQLAALTLTAKGDWRSPKGITRALGPAYAQPAARDQLREVLSLLKGVAGARERLLELSDLPTFALAREDEVALGALSRVLQVAAAQLQTQLAVTGRVDHTYVGGAARAALADGGDPSDLALRIGFSLRHILVDELQDTSLAQLELLESLTIGWEEGDGRSLFMVGDPMQSIYQFREAEVGLFLKVRDQGIGDLRLKALQLTRNFRAAPALIEWSNRVCAQIFPAEDDMRAAAVRFTPSQPGREGPRSTDCPVRLALLPDRQAEGRWCAQGIAALRAAHPQSSCAVLVAARAHAAPVLAALAELDIPAIGVDLVPLSDLPIIQDLVALTRALHHLGDRSAWLTLLRAPWCGLPLSSLSVLCQRQDELIWQALADDTRLAQCPEEEQLRLARVREVLKAALASRGREPLADWLERTWVRLGAPDAYAQEALPHARAFFSALAENVSNGDWRGPQDLGPLLATLHAAPADTAGNPVSVMTIHRAKGLEFDHVFLPGLDRVQARDREPLLRWLDLPRAAGSAHDSDLLMAPVPALDAEETGEVGRYLKRLMQRRAASEQVRLLYVAITRARHTLHLCGSPRITPEGPRPRAGTLLLRLWPALEGAFEVHAPQPEVPPSPAPEPRRITRLQRLVSAWKPARPPPAVAASFLPLVPEEPEISFSWVGDTARHIGTVAHAALCALGQEPQLPEGAALVARRASFAASLRRLGVPPKELEAATLEVLQVLLRTLADERGRWIFGSHREAHSGLALSGLISGRLSSVVIDRCFVDAKGIRWVLDFKTSRHQGGSLDTFLAQEVQRHKAQLQRCATLARDMGPEPVRAALYFPLLQAFREVKV